MTVARDPVELILPYVLAKAPTDGFRRLWQAGHLELTVEAVAWRNRHLLEASVGAAAAKRLKQYDCDVETMPPLGG